MPVTSSFQPVEFGNYLLVAQIGRGGMAEVFKARARGAAGFERVVCVKRILRQHTEDQHFLDMFVNEAKISARLTHPNIVQVYELGLVDGEFFMAMEFVHGKDLLRVIRTVSEKGQFPPTVAAYIAREMCRALAHAHEHVDEDGVQRPIVHRDVSPQNVLISYDGIVKLCDFGIAKAGQMPGQDETRTGALKGKFAYMAPEQLDGTKASPTTDIFSVGVTLHEMLTGRRLFKGSNDFDTLVRVKTQLVPPPSALNPATTPELDHIVLTALNRDASMRYQRAGQMARDLEQFCARAGFTADDMKEFMTRMFPHREEIPDGVVQLPSTSASLLSRSRVGPAEQTPVSHKKPPSRLPLLVVGGVAMAGIAVGVTLLLLRDRPHPAPLADRPIAAAVDAQPAAPPPPARPPAVEKVRLDTNPTGAEVTDGPRILGTTPLDLRITPSRPKLDLQIRKGGFEDLDYHLTIADAPSVTLKLVAKKTRPKTDRKPRDDAPTAPKIQTIDD